MQSKLVLRFDPGAKEKVNVLLYNVGIAQGSSNVLVCFTVI